MKTRSLGSCAGQQKKSGIKARFVSWEKLKKDIDRGFRFFQNRHPALQPKAERYHDHKDVIA